MAKRHNVIKEINGEIDSAVDNFNKSIPKIEKDLSSDISTIIKDLDVGKDGRIKPTVKNLRKMGAIERRMSSAFQSDDYLKNVDEFTASYDSVRSLESKYFDITLAKFAEPAVMPEIQKQSINAVTDALTGSNITANVIDPVNNLVRQGIESGQQWDDLRGSIGNFLQGADGGTGALSRYTTTITNDSLNTYARTYENIVADQEGIEWFEYVGREVVDTREFCMELDRARWFKRSDIDELIGGSIKNYKSGKTTRVPIYKKTKKPYGMKAETNTQNFIQLCGGWNCGHHAYPVPTELVPDNIKNSTGDSEVAQLPQDDTQKWLDEQRAKLARRKQMNIGIQTSSNPLDGRMYYGLDKKQMGVVDELNNKMRIKFPNVNDARKQPVAFMPKTVAHDDVFTEKWALNLHKNAPPVSDTTKLYMSYDKRTPEFNKWWDSLSRDVQRTVYDEQQSYSKWYRNQFGDVLTNTLPVRVMPDAKGIYSHGKVSIVHDIDDGLEIPTISDDFDIKLMRDRTTTRMIRKFGGNAEATSSAYIHEMGHYISIPQSQMIHREMMKWKMHDGYGIFPVKNTVSEYAMVNEAEWFAETYTMYVINPNALKKYNSKVYKFMDYIVPKLDAIK